MSENMNVVKIYIPVKGFTPYSLTRLKNRPTLALEQAIMLCHSIVEKYIGRGDYEQATGYQELSYHLEHEIYKRRNGTTTFNSN